MKYWVIGFESRPDGWQHLQWDFEAKDEALVFVHEYQEKHPNMTIGIIYGEWLRIEDAQ